MKQIVHKSFKAEFKPGLYFIGDPCYALRDDLYDKWGNDNNYDDGDYGYFAVGSTAYGDGTYKDNISGHEFCVDAGILGVVNMKYANPDANKDGILNRLGKLISVKKSLKFEYDHEKALFSYEYDDSYIEIPTMQFDDEEDYDEEDYDEEDDCEIDW